MRHSYFSKNSNAAFFGHYFEKYQEALGIDPMIDLDAGLDKLSQYLNKRHDDAQSDSLPTIDEINAVKPFLDLLSAIHTGKAYQDAELGERYKARGWEYINEVWTDSGIDHETRQQDGRKLDYRQWQDAKAVMASMYPEKGVALLRRVFKEAAVEGDASDIFQFLRNRDEDKHLDAHHNAELAALLLGDLIIRFDLNGHSLYDGARDFEEGFQHPQRREMLAKRNELAEKNFAEHIEPHISRENFNYLCSAVPANKFTRYNNPDEFAIGLWAQCVPDEELERLFDVKRTSGVVKHRVVEQMKNAAEALETWVVGTVVGSMMNDMAAKLEHAQGAERESIEARVNQLAGLLARDSHLPTADKITRGRSGTFWQDKIDSMPRGQQLVA